MTVLDIVLAVKIVGTGLFAALPLTLLPAGRVTRVLGVDPSAMPYLRLYGVATVALLVGYAFGFSALSGGTFPLGVVCMGIVSNGLAALTLVHTGAFRQNRLLTLLVTAVAVSLIIATLDQDLAMTRLNQNPLWSS